MVMMSSDARNKENELGVQCCPVKFMINDYKTQLMIDARSTIIIC